MVFSSLTFLYAYLPVVLIVYFLCPWKYRNLVLFLVSLFFYGWGEPVYVLVMLASILMNWLMGKIIARREGTAAKRALILCIIFNLCLLGFFKYADFLINNLRALGLRSLHPLNISLPIGISFYTFQTMSYPIDLYRRQTTEQKSFISFGAYVVMFPQLIAGPIVRYVEVVEELGHRTISLDDVHDGLLRFCQGLAKKVLLANACGAVFEEISALPDPDMSVLTAWLGILFYAFQIYYDFSGYSDMAIGIGRILGFHFPENFNHPYTADSITDFWRRWHMTLSYWFRDYVYIPLGGNRKGLPRQILNILIVWFLTGMWHGAAWNFIIWGLLYGIVLILEKVFLLRYLQRSPKILRHGYTMIIVLIAWVFFAFTDLGKALHYLSLMFTSPHLYSGLTLYYLRDNLTVLVLAALASTTLLQNCGRRLQKAAPWTVPVLCVLCLLICTAFIVDASYNPFLYFRF
ncbi:MAG: MBOAT family protein [Solobacterium sp.]|nr:MBOAT family protein [Solobacterium sp.]